jgi:hypothetical protein
MNAEEVLSILEEVMPEDLLDENKEEGGSSEKMSVRDLKVLAKKRKKHHSMDDIKAGKRAAKSLGKAGRERRAKLAAKTRKRHGR